MTFKARKRLAILVLVLGVPAYIVVAVTLVNLFERPSPLVELAIYIGLGVIWALPFKSVFKGIGQAPPEDEESR